MEVDEIGFHEFSTTLKFNYFSLFEFKRIFFVILEKRKSERIQYIHHIIVFIFKEKRKKNFSDLTIKYFAFIKCIHINGIS